MNKRFNKTQNWIIDKILELTDSEKKEDVIIVSGLKKIIPSKYDLYENWPEALWNKVHNYLKNNLKESQNIKSILEFLEKTVLKEESYEDFNRFRDLIAPTYHTINQWSNLYERGHLQPEEIASIIEKLIKIQQIINE